MTQMDESKRNMVKVEAHCKRKDKYNPPRKRRNNENKELKRIEGMLSTVLHKVKTRKVWKISHWQAESPFLELPKQVCEPDWIRRLAQYKSCTELVKLNGLEKQLGASLTSLAMSMQTVESTP
uniref:Uncharacterized protein n=1 Tax=Solanum tuberosum TaxID=4113 RepID=M1DAR2_SOLTU